MTEIDAYKHNERILQRELDSFKDSLYKSVDKLNDKELEIEELACEVENLKTDSNALFLETGNLKKELSNFEQREKYHDEFAIRTREELADKDELIKVLSRTLKIIL